MGFPILLKWDRDNKTVAVPSGGWRRDRGGDVIARYADQSELAAGNFVMLALRPLADPRVLAEVQAGLRIWLGQRETEREPPDVL